MAISYDFLNYLHGHGYLPVQVDRKANPPVCKIMDFHKEKYKKETKEKERLKTKVSTPSVNFLPISAIGIGITHQCNCTFNLWSSNLCTEYSCSIIYQI